MTIFYVHFHRAEYNRNRVKMMEISAFIDAHRSEFFQLKDILIAKYGLQAHFQVLS